MNVEFFPSSKETELFVPKPKPSKKFIPTWYKNVAPTNQEQPIFDSNGNVRNKTIKSCVPFLDALTHGWIQESWTDIFIQENNKEILNFTFSSAPQILYIREKKYLQVKEFSNFESVWSVQWIPKLPKGWSMLFTHPLNQYELPFTTLSGIVDSDNFFHSTNGNLPFYFKKNFTGLIPAGTPLFQMIPVKRENWTSNTIKYDDDETKIRQNIMNKNFWNIYRNQFWKKKSFE